MYFTIDRRFTDAAARAKLPHEPIGRADSGRNHGSDDLPRRATTDSARDRRSDKSSEPIILSDHARGAWGP